MKKIIIILLVFISMLNVFYMTLVMDEKSLLLNANSNEDDYVIIKNEENYRLYSINNGKYTEVPFKILNKDEEEMLPAISNNDIIKIVYDDISSYDVGYKNNVLTDKETISDSINKTKEIFSRFNEKLLNEFILDEDKGIEINLTGSIFPINNKNTVANPSGYSFYSNDKYVIFIDANQKNYDEVLCHEFMHIMEYNLQRKNKQVFSEWQDFNPPNFNYSDSYNANVDDIYTLNEKDVDNIYFINTYSKTYSSEDRATIFSSVCAYQNYYDDYPKINAKANYIMGKLEGLYGINIFN